MKRAILIVFLFSTNLRAQTTPPIQPVPTPPSPSTQTPLPAKAPPPAIVQKQSPPPNGKSAATISATDKNTRLKNLQFIVVPKGSFDAIARSQFYTGALDISGNKGDFSGSSYEFRFGYGFYKALNVYFIQGYSNYAVSGDTFSNTYKGAGDTEFGISGLYDFNETNYFFWELGYASPIADKSKARIISTNQYEYNGVGNRPKTKVKLGYGVDFANFSFGINYVYNYYLEGSNEVTDAMNSTVTTYTEKSGTGSAFVLIGQYSIFSRYKIGIEFGEVTNNSYDSISSSGSTTNNALVTTRNTKVYGIIPVHDKIEILTTIERPELKDVPAVSMNALFASLGIRATF